MSGEASAFVEELCTAGIDAREKEIKEYVERESAPRLCYELRRVLLSACSAGDWARVQGLMLVYMGLINKKVIDGYKFITVLDDVFDSKPYPECRHALAAIEALAVELKAFIAHNSQIKYKIFTGPFNRFSKRIAGIDPALSGRVKAFMIFVFPDLDPKREDHLAAPIPIIIAATTTTTPTTTTDASSSANANALYDAFWAVVASTKTPGSFLAAIKSDPKVIATVETAVYAPLRKKCAGNKTSAASISGAQHRTASSAGSYSCVDYLRSPALFPLQLEDEMFARVVVSQIVMTARYLHKRKSTPEITSHVRDALAEVESAGLDLLEKTAPADGKAYVTMLKRVLDDDIAEIASSGAGATGSAHAPRPSAPPKPVVLPHQMAAKLGRCEKPSEDECMFKEFCECMSAPRSRDASEKAPEITPEEFLRLLKDFYDKKGPEAVNDEKAQGNPAGSQLYKWRALRIVSEKKITALPEFIERNSDALDAVYNTKKAQHKAESPRPQQQQQSIQKSQVATPSKPNSAEPPKTSQPQQSQQQQQNTQKPQPVTPEKRLPETSQQCPNEEPAKKSPKVEQKEKN